MPSRLAPAKPAPEKETFWRWTILDRAFDGQNRRPFIALTQIPHGTKVSGQAVKAEAAFGYMASGCDPLDLGGMVGFMGPCTFAATDDVFTPPGTTDGGAAMGVIVMAWWMDS
ncbi:hypothetical protein AAL_02895 [Moelleriella libera RCEF 2490]|uniref:Uncharacterized protein n=1 Tax=Moelleriella libera RCEF 2490 TaxID=1081109 RepID=A0A168E3J3_9HYPO|nr:hypothetical protein AAL_02895 [Moelleriella libera RCEF 2490]